MSLGLSGESLEDFASALRQLRRRHARERNDTQLTYRELALKSGYSRSTIGDYISGKALPPTDRLDVLAMLLGATGEERSALATARDRIEERLRRRPVAGPGKLPAETPEIPFDLPLVAERYDELAPVRYRFTRKSLRAVIASGTGTGAGTVQRRRDATLTWTVELANVSSRPLTHIELPLAGEVPVEEAELQVRISSPTHEVVCSARVREQPGFTPVIDVVMPHPGLAPGASTSLQYTYTWPALAHAFSDRWFVVTAGMESGAKVDLRLVYPLADPQTARVELIRRGPGRWTAESLGELPAYAGESWTVEMTHAVGVDEFALLVRTDRVEAVA